MGPTAGPENPKCSDKAANPLKSLISLTLADDSLWKEQSCGDESGCSATPNSKSHYIVVKSISPSINEQNDDVLASKLEPERGVLLKETTV